MIRLVTFGSGNMTVSMQKCVDSAMKHGVYSYNDFAPLDISSEFFKNNIAVLTKERGAGFWLWKPYFINMVINEMPEGYYLIYSDAGVEFVAGVRNIINRMDEDIFFFTNGHKQVEWCKADCYENINWERSAIYDICTQVQASVIFFKVNQKTRDFVKEWLLWCQMPGFIDDSSSKIPNYPTFSEHRHDQSVLTCLQIKYGYKLHWWPTAYAEHIRVPGDVYPVMFNHHRKRNNEW